MDRFDRDDIDDEASHLMRDMYRGTASYDGIQSDYKLESSVGRNPRSMMGDRFKAIDDDELVELKSGDEEYQQEDVSLLIVHL